MAKNKFNVNDTLGHPLDLMGSKGDELNKKARMYRLILSEHRNYLLNIVTNLFTWNGLGNGGDGRPLRSSFIEMILAYQGCMAITRLPEYSVPLFTPCTIVGQLNLWGEPKTIKLTPPYNSEDYDYRVLYKTLSYKETNFVFVRNDNICTGFAPLIEQTANALSEIMMSLITNASQQKFPVIFKGTKDTVLSMEVLQNKIDAWETYILVKDKSKFEDIGGQIFNKNVPFVADKLYQSYQDILNNFFMRVGINMIPNAKKERMLTDEVNANNQAVETAGDVYLNCRIEACEQANEMLGLDLSVERNHDFIDSLKNIPTPMGREQEVSFMKGDD